MRLSDKAKERLLKLAEFMDSLPPEAAEHFHMHDLIKHSGQGHDHQLGERPTMDALLTCGTTACALGWACAMPYFQELGLRLSWDDGRCWANDSNEIFDLTEGDGDEGDPFEIAFGSHNSDADPKAWAKRIREWVAAS